MLLPFDELDNLISEWRMPFQPELDRERVIDEIYEMLVLAYVYGYTNVTEDLGVDSDVRAEKAEPMIYKRVAGQTWVERVNAAFDNAEETARRDEDGGSVIGGEQVVTFTEDLDGEEVSFTEPLVDIIIRIVETETTRVFSGGGDDGATDAEAQTKKNAVKEWVTMGDERVRDTHAFLNGTKIPVSEKFHTIDGDEARYPGDFAMARNNVNCRCYCKYTWEK